MVGFSIKPSYCFWCWLEKSGTYNVVGVDLFIGFSVLEQKNKLIRSNTFFHKHSSSLFSKYIDLNQDKCWRIELLSYLHVPLQSHFWKQYTNHFEGWAHRLVKLKQEFDSFAKWILGVLHLLFALNVCFPWRILRRRSKKLTVKA